MRVTLAMRAAVGMAAAIAILIFSGSAMAAVVSSSITTPSDPTFFQGDDNNPANPANTVTISGTATDDGTPGNVDIVCTAGSGSTHFVSNVPVSYSGDTGTFSTTYDIDNYTDETCRLHAVPAGSVPADLTPFAGPRLGIGEYGTSTYSGGPADGKAYDFFDSAGQMTGIGDYESFTNGGMYDAYPIDPNTLAMGADLFYANDTYDGLVDGATRSSIEVDGMSAYGTDAAKQVCGSSTCSMAGIPALTVSQSFNESNGDLTIHDSEPLVKCEPDPATYPPTSVSCTSFASTGVTVNRTITQDSNGRQSTVTDTYVSTDGAAHNLDLYSLEDAQNADAGYDFPWVDGSTYKTHTAGDTEPAPSSAPATVYVDWNNTLADGDESSAQGAITFGSKPTGFDFAAHGDAGQTHLRAHFVETVPAGGSTTLSQVFSWAFTKADAQALAAAAQAALHAPVVTITSPTNGGNVTKSPVTASGTVSASPGQGGLDTFTVDGQSVPVAANGTWSTSLPAHVGSNTITAVATDHSGKSGQAQVTFQLPAPHVKLVKKSFNGKSVVVKLSCKKSGSQCAGTITLTYRWHKHNRKLGSAKYSIKPGHSATIKVRLNKLGRHLHKKLGAITVKGKVTLLEPGQKTKTPVKFKQKLVVSKKHH